MATKKEISEGTPAAETLKQGSSKSEMMATLVGKMAGMSTEDLSHLFNRTLEQIGHEADSIPSNAAASNAATIAAKKTVKEDLAALFAGNEDLTEDFAEKAATLFEAAVDLRVNARLGEIEEEFEDRLTVSLNEALSEIEEAVDDYITYTANEWLKENEVAIDHSIRAEISEDFIVGLKNLFLEHNITVPENKVDLVSELAERIEELESELDSAIDENLSLNKLIENAVLSSVVDEVSEGLTLPQKEQLFVVAETVEFVDENDFRSKLNLIKESLIEGKTAISSGIVNEEVTADDLNEDTTVTTSASGTTVSRAAAAISRTTRKI